jgi:hypothetical protein
VKARAILIHSTFVRNPRKYLSTKAINTLQRSTHGNIFVTIVNLHTISQQAVDNINLFGVYVNVTIENNTTTIKQALDSCIYIWHGPTLFEGPNLIVGITKIDAFNFTILPHGFSFPTPHTHPSIPTPFSTLIPQYYADTHITYMGCGAAGGWAAATLAISAINTTPFGQFTGIDQNQESIDIFAKRYPQTKSFCGRLNSRATLQQALHSTILIHSGTHQTLANKGKDSLILLILLLMH